MTLNLKSLLIIPIFLLIACAVQANITGKVVSVADGDTITILHNKKQYRIRLYGIDCPEKKQAYGTKAKQFTSDLIFGKVVRIVETERDRHGRTVGVVYVGDRCVNEALLKSGYAWVNSQYCKKCKAWIKFEENARKNKRGLWADKNPIPPWEFRSEKKGFAKSLKSNLLHIMAT